MSRVPAFYARFSSDLQNPSSAADQLDRLREHLGRTSHEKALEFSDEGISGSVWRERPGVQGLLQAVKSKKVGVIYTESLDRISRDVGDLHEFRKLLKHYSVDLVSVADGVRLDGSSGAAMLFMMRSFAAEQSVRDTADKSQRGLRANAMAGKTTGGTLYGYQRTKVGESRKGTAIRKYEIDPGQAQTVRQVFRMYAEGLGYSAIAASLNAEGIAPPRGPQKDSKAGSARGWVASCIREMLRNSKYVGLWRFGVREWGRHPETERRVVRKRRDVALPADRERLVETERPDLAIVAPALWERVQARVDEHRGRYERRDAALQKSSYLLSGLLRCATCGALMTISGGKAARYRCSANFKRGTCDNKLSVRESTLREGIVAAIADQMSRPATLALMKARAAAFLRKQNEVRAARLSAGADERRTLEAQVAKNEARLKQAHLRSLDGDTDPDLDELVRELRQTLKADRGKLAGLVSPRGDAPLPDAKELDELTRYACSLSFLNELDAEYEDAKPFNVRVAECREALRKLLKNGSIVLEPDSEGRIYTASLALWPLALAYSNRGCAGRI